MFKLLTKLRNQAQDLTYNDYSNFRSWKAALMETIFRPDFPTIPGKGPMDMLHPDIKKLHLPPGMYIADWRKYRVEDHACLVKFQQRCHAAGLHDPWLRQECFQCYENLGGGFRSRTASVFYQIHYGFAFAVVFYILQQTYLKYYPIYLEHSPEYLEKYGPEGKPKHH